MKKVLFTIPAIALLSACGGGGSDEVAPTTSTLSVSGRAIDGYIVGANVYYDMNMNGVHDSDEPNAITQEGGVFEIQGELTEAQSACLDYVPLIVDVPVGAVDEDLGTVEDAYSLSFPPSFVFDADPKRSPMNVTPISNALWISALQNVVQELPDGNYTCEAIRDNLAMRQAVGDAMRNVTNDLVHNFNIPEEELYQDYIATGNDENYRLAQQLLVISRLSFDETYQLSRENPGWHVNIAYYKNDATDEGANDDWYKQTLIMNDTVRKETIELIGVGWQPAAVLRDTYSEAIVTEDGTFTYETEYRTSNTRSGVYSCAASESFLSTVGDDSSAQGITNRSVSTGVERETCMDEVFNMNADNVSVTIANSNRVNDIGDKISYQWTRITTDQLVDENDPSSGYVTFGELPAEFSAWIDFPADREGFDVEGLKLELANLPMTEDQDTIGADWWNWSSRYVADGNQYNENFSSNGGLLPNGTWHNDHVRWVVFANGTHETQYLVNGAWLSWAE